jgi:putative serine protease PepD
MSEHSSDAQSHTHRYGPGATATTAAGRPTPGHHPGPGLGSPLPPLGQPGAPLPPPPRRRGGPGIVIAAVLAGALAGTAGAAGYSAATDDDTTTPSSATSLDTTPVSNNADDNAADGAVEQVATAVQPSVVQINTTGNQGAGNGTGIIISSDGQILTNNHVVESAENGGSITVLFNDGTTADATIVGRDPVTDVAVIQAEDVSGLQPATLGSSDGLEVGEEVVAIGSPFGLESTVTSGIVSALNRPVTASSSSGATDPTVFPAIQTDAAINPGNSGGPLVNMNGQVIGINSAIYGEAGGSIGLGFAIPIDLARSIANQLVAGETPTHARIGITVTDAVESDQITTVGARIDAVEDDSAGSDAGLESGDIVTEVDGRRVTSANGLIALIRSYRPGDEVTVTYLRDGDEHEADVTLDSDGGDLTS